MSVSGNLRSKLVSAYLCSLVTSMTNARNPPSSSRLAYVFLSAYSEGFRTAVPIESVHPFRGFSYTPAGFGFVTFA